MNVNPSLKHRLIVLFFGAILGLIYFVLEIRDWASSAGIDLTIALIASVLVGTFATFLINFFTGLLFGAIELVTKQNINNSLLQASLGLIIGGILGLLVISLPTQTDRFDILIGTILGMIIGLVTVSQLKAEER